MVFFTGVEQTYYAIILTWIIIVIPVEKIACLVVVSSETYIDNILLQMSLSAPYWGREVVSLLSAPETYMQWI